MSGPHVTAVRPARGTIRCLPNRDGTVRWSLYFRRKGEKPFEKRFPEFTSPDDRVKVEAAAERYRHALSTMAGRVNVPNAETVKVWFERYLDSRAASHEHTKLERARAYLETNASRGRVNKHGYRVIGDTAVHRLVMQAYLGRKLVAKENVHHKNGDRLDNRIENLELWNTHQPAGQRPADKVRYATEILALYGTQTQSD